MEFSIDFSLIVHTFFDALDALDAFDAFDFSLMFRAFFDAHSCYLAGDVRESEKAKNDDSFTF